jgi:hypothetical protein
VAADSEGKFTDRYLKLTPTTVSQQVSMRFAAFRLCGV